MRCFSLVKSGVRWLIYYTRCFFPPLCVVLFLLYSWDLVLVWLKRGQLFNEVTVSTMGTAILSSLFKFSSFDCFKHGSYIEWVRTRYSDILKGKFEAERVETEVVVCISDGNVASLGLSKIGDRSNGSENFAQILRKKTKERATVRGKTIQKEWGRREIYFFSTDLQ